MIRSRPQVLGDVHLAPPVIDRVSHTFLLA